MCLSTGPYEKQTRYTKYVDKIGGALGEAIIRVLRHARQRIPLATPDATAIR